MKHLSSTYEIGDTLMGTRRGRKKGEAEYAKMQFVPSRNLQWI
jgi:hypothetical protein